MFESVERGLCWRKSWLRDSTATLYCCSFSRAERHVKDARDTSAPEMALRLTQLNLFHQCVFHLCRLWILSGFGFWMGGGNFVRWLGARIFLLFADISSRISVPSGRRLGPFQTYRAGVVICRARTLQKKGSQSWVLRALSCTIFTRVFNLIIFVSL